MTAPLKPAALKLTASLVAASLAALALIAAIDSASAAQPTKNTLYKGALVNKATGASEGSIRLKVTGDKTVIRKVIARPQCDIQTFFPHFEYVKISQAGAFNASELTGLSASIKLTGKFKSKTKATGEVKINGSASECGGNTYKFTALKGSS